MLISGSGAQDRDESILGHRPFLVLADYLTRNGIAVLRVDDRGVGGSTGDVTKATSEDFAGDVLAGVEYLKNRKDINPEKIGLIGHSEGGIIAPLVASRSSDIAFIVLMAGSGINGEELLYTQGKLVLKAMGTSDTLISWHRDFQEQMFSVVKQKLDSAGSVQKLNEIIDKALIKLTDEEKMALGLSDETAHLQVTTLLSPWFRFILTYDPQPVLLKVKCPVLAIIGEKDLQVAPKENLRAIEEALKTGGNKNYTVKLLPGLNHLFQTAETGSPAEYMLIEETISPLALETITQWVLRQTS